MAGAAVSIVEKTRQYLKSAHGSQRTIVPRALSFCQFTFLTRLPVVLVVEDAQQDERCALRSHRESGFRAFQPKS